MKKKTTVFIFLFLLPNFVNAQTQVTVVGKKNQADSGGEKIEFSATPAGNSSLTSILSREKGIYINRYGAPGTVSTISLRGNSVQQTGIFLDGIPLSDEQTGSFNLEDIPVEILESATIYRDYLPGIFPGLYPGGGINLVTDSEKSDKYRWTIGVDSIESGKAAAAISINGNTFIGWASFSRAYYLYKNDNGTSFYNTSDDFVKLRENSDYFRAGALTELNFPIGNSLWKFLGLATGSEKGLPGTMGREILHVRSINYLGLIKAEGVVPLNNSIRLHTSADLTGEYSSLKDPASEILFGADQTTQQKLRSGLSVYPEIRLGYFTLIPSLSGRAAMINQNQLPFAVRYNAEPSFRILTGNVEKGFSTDTQLKASLISDQTAEEYRKSVYQNVPEKNNRQAGQADLRLAEMLKFRSGKVRFSVSGGAGNRLPTLSESFGDGTFLAPSPSLTSERYLKYSTDAGLWLKIYKINLIQNISWYQQRTENMILIVQNSSSSAIAINAQIADLKGVEYSAHFDPFKYIETSLKYSLLLARDISEIPYYFGKYLPNRPRHTLSATIALGPEKWKIFSEVLYRGALYRDRYNSYYAYLKARAEISCGYQIMLISDEKLKIKLNVQNLTDNQEPDVTGYPLPGRYVSATLSGSF